MPARPAARDIDEYIAQAPPQARQALTEIRAIVRAVAPDATETIGYSMPAFDLNGKHLVFFAGYERHVGLYPLPGAVEAFGEELKRYKHARGSIQFPLDEPLPVDLIRRMIEYRVRERRERG
jgi:uncharacterized protein YdhG (YjbR/CyaY superfamily)